MNTPQNNRLEEIFAAAVAIPDAERAAWLDAACEGKAVLRVEIEELLQSHQASDFMDGARNPAIEQELARLKPEEPGDQIGPYRLIEQLGEGGFGVVWKAEQKWPVQRIVALKIIKVGMDTKEVIARFEQERQALAVMDHPNIAKVYDAGATLYGRPYFAMELVPGKRITEYCDARGMGVEERLELFIAVCQAVQHAHQKGIIHRDLKPSNILVKLQDGKPAPMVIDFGVAKAVERRLTEITIYTEFEQLIGTPLYMSPEQVELGGVNVDTRADIYALGVVLYELLTGRTPFERETLMEKGYEEMRRIIREVEPPKPSTAMCAMAAENLQGVASQRHSETARLIHDLRGDLDWIVMKALEKDRARRYETVSDLLQDIERHLRREPVLARPPSRMYRFGRLVRRNRLIFSAAGAVVGTLIAGLSISIWHAVVAKTATGQALLAKDDAVAAQGRAEAAARKEAEAREEAIAQEAAAKSLAYAASMNLIQRAWDRNEVAVVRELLNRTKDYAQRGFEWYYWQKVCHQDLLSIRGHASGITALAISSDGSRLASGDDNGVVIISDLKTGRRELIFPKETPSRGGFGSDSITALAFSPDGRRIGVGSKLGRFGISMIYDLETNKRGPEPTFFQQEAIRNVIFSPDGQRMATVTDRDAYVWDATSGSRPRVLKGEATKIWWVRFSKEREELVVPTQDGEFLPKSDRWNLGLQYPGAGGATNSVERKSYLYQRSTDGQRIISQGVNGTEVWNLETGQKKRLGYHGSTDEFALSSDGGRIITSRWNIVTAFETSTGRELFTLQGHSTLVTCIAHSGDRIVTGSADGEVKVWDGKGPPMPTVFPSRSKPLISVFYPDGQRVLVIENGVINVLDVATHRLLFALKPQLADASGKPLFNAKSLICAAISPDGKLIAASMPWAGIVIWDASTGVELRRLGMSSPDGNGHRLVVPVGFSARNHLLTGGYYETRIAKLVTIAPPLAKHWDIKTGRELTAYPRFGDGISAVAAARDASLVLTADVLGTIAVWNTSDQTKRFLLKAHSAEVGASAFFPRDHRFVTASADGTAKIWNSSNGELLRTLKGHTKSVNAVVVDSSGTRIVTGSDDKTIKIWDAVGGSELLTLDAGVEVRSVSLTKEGDRLLSTAMGIPNPSHMITYGTRIWDVASEEQVKKWQAEELLTTNPKLEEVVQKQAPEKVDEWFRNPTASIWKGVAYDHRSRSARLLASSKQPSSLPDSVDEAVKFLCLLPPFDSKLIADALASIRKVVSDCKSKSEMPWYRMTLGMAEYRSGNYAAADEALIAAEQLTAGNDAYRPAFCTAKLFHAMSLYRQEKVAEAKDCFAAAETKMRPISAVEPDVAAQLADHDDLIVWIAYKEAKALLQRGPPKENSWNSFDLLRDAALLARDGKDAEHLNTCRRILKFADSLEYPDDAERAARMYSLRPSTDPDLMKAALLLARGAVSKAGDIANVPWYQLTLGMAEYRAGNYEAADAALIAAESASGNTSSVKHFQPTASFFRAMSLFRQGKEVAAIACLLKLEIGIKPNASEGNLVVQEDVDDLILALAKREARSLLQPILDPARRYQAYSMLIELPETSEADRSQLLLDRSSLLREMNREDEAAADNIRALGIAGRAANADESTIDLSLHFNAPLKGNWHGDAADNDLSGLPVGMQSLGGTNFDCRGLVQLRSAKQGLSRFPIQVSQIKLQRNCGQVRFLHACIHGHEVESGTEIGKYRFHYADGQIRELPIVAGRDVLDWWAKPTEESTKNGLMVGWQGTNEKSKREGTEVRLFKTSWENPLPNVKVERVEFVSNLTKSAPFLVAITAGP